MSQHQFYFNHQHNTLGAANLSSIPSLISLSPFISHDKSQIIKELPFGYYEAPDQNKPAQPKNVPSHDFTLDPIKRMKFNEQDKLQHYPRPEDGYQNILSSILGLSSQRGQHDIQQPILQRILPGVPNLLEESSCLAFVQRAMQNDQNAVNLGLSNSLLGMMTAENLENQNLNVPMTKALPQETIYGSNPVQVSESLEHLKTYYREQQLIEQRLSQLKAQQQHHHQYLQNLQQIQAEEFMKEQLANQRQTQAIFDEKLAQRQNLAQLTIIDPKIFASLGLTSNMPYNIFDSHLNPKYKTPKDIYSAPTFDTKLAEAQKLNLNLMSVAPEKALDSSKCTTLDIKIPEFVAPDDYKAGESFLKLPNIIDKCQDNLNKLPPQTLRVHEIPSQQPKNKKVKTSKPPQQSLNKKRHLDQSLDFCDVSTAKPLTHRDEVPGTRCKWQPMIQDKTRGSDASSAARRAKRLETRTLPNGEISHLKIEPADPQKLEQNSENLRIEAKSAYNRRRRRHLYEVENDENVDYNHLISVRITNDPLYTGSNGNNKDFVVVSQRNDTEKEEKVEEEEVKIKGAQVSKLHQAVITELDLGGPPATSRRRNPNLIWNPKASNENQVQKYLNELCEALKCTRVNEERALKMLKRKNYKKDKVLINVSKNEKFYSGYLVVQDNIISVASNGISLSS